MAQKATLVLLAVLAAPLFAETNPVALAGLFSSGDRFQVKAELVVDEKGSDPFQRNLLFRFERLPVETRLLVTVEAPSYLKNLKFLRKDGKNRSDLWIKTSKGVKRLAGTGDEPLFSSDFTTGDFTLTDREWTEAPRSDAQIRTFVTVSKTGERQVLTLRSADLLVVRSQRFDAKGTPVKTYEVTAWQPGSVETPQPLTVRMTDFTRSSTSTLTLSGLQTQEFPANTFAPGGL